MSLERLVNRLGTIAKRKELDFKNTEYRFWDWYYGQSELDENIIAEQTGDGRLFNKQELAKFNPILDGKIVNISSGINGLILYIIGKDNKIYEVENWLSKGKRLTTTLYRIDEEDKTE